MAPKSQPNTTPVLPQAKGVAGSSHGVATPQRPPVAVSSNAAATNKGPYQVKQQPAVAPAKAAVGKVLSRGVAHRGGVPAADPPAAALARDSHAVNAESRSSSRRGSLVPSAAQSRAPSPVDRSRHHAACDSRYGQASGTVPLLTSGAVAFEGVCHLPQRGLSGTAGGRTAEDFGCFQLRSTSLLELRESNCDSSPSAEVRDTASFVLPWRHRCRVDELLSRSTQPVARAAAVATPEQPRSAPLPRIDSGGVTSARPATQWAVDWFGTQLRRGGPGTPFVTPSSNAAAGGGVSDATASGIGASGQGGALRSDHLFLATTALSAGRPCDALSVFESLCAMDPVLGVNERQLLFDAITAFTERKRQGVSRAAAALAKQGRPAAEGGYCESRLLLDWAVQDLVATTARITRLLVWDLIAGAIAPAKHTVVTSAVYHKWLLDLLSATCRSVVDAGHDHESALAPVRDVLMRVAAAALQHLETCASGQAAGESGTATPSLDTSTSQSPLPPCVRRTHGKHFGRGSVQATLSYGSPYVEGLIYDRDHRARCSQSLPPPPSSSDAPTTPSGGFTVDRDADWSARRLSIRVASCYVQLAMDCQALLPSTHAMRCAVAVGAMNAANSLGPDPADVLEPQIWKSLIQCLEGIDYELALALDDSASAASSRDVTRVHVQLLKKMVESVLPVHSPTASWEGLVATVQPGVPSAGPRP